MTYYASVVYKFQKSEVVLPEPFKTELSCYFNASKFECLDWSRVDDLKKDILVIALRLCNGNQVRVADLLGMKRSHVFELRKRYGL